MSDQRDIIIIGAGAAGMNAAYVAAEPGLAVEEAQQCALHLEPVGCRWLCSGALEAAATIDTVPAQK